jgi:hypothetical protein
VIEWWSAVSGRRRLEDVLHWARERRGEGLERVMQQACVFCTSCVPSLGRPAGLTLSGRAFQGAFSAAPSLRLAG